MKPTDSVRFSGSTVYVNLKSLSAGQTKTLLEAVQAAQKTPDADGTYCQTFDLLDQDTTLRATLHTPSGKKNTPMDQTFLQLGADLADEVKGQSKGLKHIEQFALSTLNRLNGYLTDTISVIDNLMVQDQAEQAATHVERDFRHRIAVQNSGESNRLYTTIHGKRSQPLSDR